MVPMKDRQLHLMIEESTYQELRRLAFTRGISLGALVRQALTQLLKKAAATNLQSPPNSTT